MIEELIELTPIQAIRKLSGIFFPEQAVNILALVNLLARYLDEDPILEKEFLLKKFEEIGIKLMI
jgi:hypothetical protein